MKYGRNEILITIIIILFLSLGIGYAYLSTELQINAKVTVKKAGCENSQDLYQRVSCNASLDNTRSTFVASTRGIEFDEAPSNTNGQGIYKKAETKNDSYPINYYRGAVTNNNVKFANMCWKIVRTTSTGGIKLIYNGVPKQSGSCENTGASSQLELPVAFNENYTSPADVGYMYGERYIYQSKLLNNQATEIVYGNDVTYNPISGEYALRDTTISTSWSDDISRLATKYHYTCFTESDSCSIVYYLHYFGDTSTAYYLELKEGNTIEKALDQMFTNTNDSAIKKVIDEWYTKNLKSYTNDYLEDTIWCNDRSVYSGSLKDKNNDARNNFSYFGAYGRNVVSKNPSLQCPNLNDSFTVSSNNGNGKLTYPVALLTADEIAMAGHDSSEATNNSYLYNGNYLWSMSPISSGTLTAYNFSLSATGILNNADVNLAYGLRPSISLKHGVSIASGNGTASNPYIIGKSS